MMEFAIQLALAVIPTIFAITLHEAAHGYAAMALGDNTARDAGRLSLNPLRHVDRVGTIILPGILLISQLILVGKVQFMFGWAKPVPVAPWAFRDPRRGMALVAAAGPAMNFVLAWLGALAILAFQGPGSFNHYAIQGLFYFILSNLVLGLFNLLPIPPLDGGRIAVGILPLNLAIAWSKLERAGIFIVLFMVFVLPYATGIDPVGAALDDILPWAFRTVFWLSGHDLGGGAARGL
jgi:Zn-dependent protease